MTTTILDRDDFRHWRLLAQWEDAVTAHDALIDWLDANPRPSLDEWTDDSRNAYSAWIGAQRAEEERLGLNTDLGSNDYGKGRINRHRLHGSFTCRLRRMVRDENDQPLYGDRVVQCPTCSALFATFSQHDHHCSDACKAAAQQARTAAKAERRRERQTKRAEVRANRSGVCLACGEQFTIQRITAKTCSEACRKRLQRKPELADQYLQLPPIRPDLDELEAEIVRQANVRLAGVMQRMDGGGDDRSEEDDRERLALKRTVWLQRCYRRLHQIAADAPALTAWLAKAGDDAVLAAFSPEYSGVILGPDLKARMEIDAYTDADVSWSVRWGRV